MKNIKLISTNDRIVYLNWDKVDSYERDKGGNYTIIRAGDSTIDVKETVEEIEQKVENHFEGHSPE